MKRFIILLAICLTACTHVPRDTKTGSEKLEQLRVEIAQREQQGLRDEITALNKVITTKQGEIEALNQKMVKASNSNLGARLGVEFGTMEQRTREVLETRVAETGASLPPPENGALEIELTRVKKELDTTRTSLEQLKATHQAKMQELSLVNAKYDEAIKTTQLATSELNSVKAKADQEVKQLNSEMQGQAISLLRKAEKENNEKEEKRIQDARIARILYGVGVALLIGAGLCVWRLHFMLAGICGCLSTIAFFLGYFIPQLEPWIFWAVFLPIFIAVPIAMWIGYRRGLFQEPPAKVGDFTIAK